MTQLSEKAMLVRLKRGQFNANITDKDATDIVEGATGVKHAGKYKKQLFAASLRFTGLRRAYDELYAYHQAHTLPWTDNGPRLLPSSMYFEYTAKIRSLRGMCDGFLKEFLSYYDLEVASDKHRLGSMSKASDYPEASEMQKRFYHDVQFQPVPAAGDFRVEIDPEDRESMERALSDAEAGMARSLVEQLIEPLKNAAERLAVPIGEKGSVFRDTLIENVLEVCERLPKLDITGDPLLAAKLKEVREIATRYNDPKVLRESVDVRAHAAEAIQSTVDDLMTTFGGMFK